MEPRSQASVNQGRLFTLLAGVCWSLAGVFIKSLVLHPAVLDWWSRC